MSESKQKIEYTIIPDGDKVEQDGWPLFGKDLFPNYEIFWARFVAPRTGRHVDYRDIWFIDGVSWEEKELSVLHYTIFKHFSYIFSHLEKAEDRDTFDFMYIKLVSILDLVEEFLFKYLVYLRKIDLDKIISSLNSTYPISDVKGLKRDLLKGKNLSIKVLSKSDRIKTHYNFSEIERIGKLGCLVRGYRNIIIHSWAFFQIHNLVLKKEVVHTQENKDWANIVRKIGDAKLDNPFIQKNFISMKQAIAQDTRDIIELINTIWEKVIGDLPEMDSKFGKNKPNRPNYSQSVPMQVTQTSGYVVNPTGYDASGSFNFSANKGVRDYE